MTGVHKWKTRWNHSDLQSTDSPASWGYVSFSFKLIVDTVDSCSLEPLSHYERLHLWNHNSLTSISQPLRDVTVPHFDSPGKKLSTLRPRFNWLSGHAACANIQVVRPPPEPFISLPFHHKSKQSPNSFYRPGFLVTPRVNASLFSLNASFSDLKISVSAPHLEVNLSMYFWKMLY